ncbi:hypothetical protein [Campylobacter mucosalis]|uniref:hypothetical protein n=1 Tax=Campylobacter mucosalis TaxID=202 RepID=UPI0014708293|nr:hypothetical protein [Campylobacter mucosalis]
MRILFLVFCMISLAFCEPRAKILSSIPPAKEIYINLQTQKCDKDCLLKLYEDDMLISFLAQFEPDINDDELKSKYLSLSGQMPFISSTNKIAVIIPQKIIKSYAKVVQNVLSSYILETNAKISLKFIQSSDETTQNIQNALNIARESGIKLFITPFTQVGTNVLNSLINKDEIAYIPTINKATTTNISQNIIFGGVAYDKQIAYLLLKAEDKISSFVDGSPLGDYLASVVEAMANKDVYQAQISGKDINIKEQLSRPDKINNSAVFLNLPLIKAVLVATQLKNLEVVPQKLLSTQINFDPHILTMIEQKDRNELYLANSINLSNDSLRATAALFNINLDHNFIAYSNAIGLEYLYANFINSTANRIFKEQIVFGQVNYDVKIYKTDGYKFIQENSTD